MNSLPSLYISELVDAAARGNVPLLRANFQKPNNDLVKQDIVSEVVPLLLGSLRLLPCSIHKDHPDMVFEHRQ